MKFMAPGMDPHSYDCAIPTGHRVDWWNHCFFAPRQDVFVIQVQMDESLVSLQPENRYVQASLEHFKRLQLCRSPLREATYCLGVPSEELAPRASLWIPQCQGKVVVTHALPALKDVFH